MTITKIDRMETGVRNLDDILWGGWPKGAITVIAGPPGTGKTTLAQQICFHNASAEKPVLYFTTLSAPSAKTLRYLSQFDFFDAGKMDNGAVVFIDLGTLLRTKGLGDVSAFISEQIAKVKPGIVVIDSFKVFNDMAGSTVELRKFSYEVAVNLMAWETTGFLLGEFGPEDVRTNPLFSIIDGLMTLATHDSSGEQQRFIQVHKMRGTDHSRDEHSFIIKSSGIEVFAPRVTITRKPFQENVKGGPARCATGITRLDELLGEGIPFGSSLLIAGVAGTGKTVLSLEFVYRGALAGEKGIVFSFEETEDRLRALALGMGWALEKEIERGMIEIVFIPQTDIFIERDLLMIRERIETFGARRVAIDSVSVFMHKIKNPQIAREKTFQLASIVQNVGAVGFFTTDIPYGSNLISRFGVEETVVDGIILLSAQEEGTERHRYVEIYKLRNTAHSKGRHNLVIQKGGISIYPRYFADASDDENPPSVDFSLRMSTGTPGLDELMDGGVLKQSVTLVSGSAGSGKSILGMQFLSEGASCGERGIYITVEEGRKQILANATELGLGLGKAAEDGLVEIVYLSRNHVRAAQLLTILAEKIKENGAQRLVFDSINHISILASSEMSTKDLLSSLAMHFKRLGVTTLFTIESKFLSSTDFVTDDELSPIADNLITLRYAGPSSAAKTLLTVIKTRGTSHDRMAHIITIDKGGLRIE